MLSQSGGLSERMVGKENFSYSSMNNSDPMTEFGFLGVSSSAADMDEEIIRSSTNFSGNHLSAPAQVGHVAGSSKAVLAALRALQDKIRRLEIERSQALEEASLIRQQVKHYELEVEHMKQRESLANQKIIQEAAAAKERMSREKAELEVKLNRTEERCKEHAKQSGDLDFKLRCSEEDRGKAETMAKQFEARCQEMEAQLATMQIKEKDISQTIVWETKRHEHELESLHSHVQVLENDVSAAHAENDAIESKRKELDRMVGQLMETNEKLVSQLARAEKKAQRALLEIDTNDRTTRTAGQPVNGKKRPMGHSAPVRGKAIQYRSPVLIPVAKSSSSSNKSRPRANSLGSSHNLPTCANITTAAMEAGRVTKIPTTDARWVPGGIRGTHANHELRDSFSKDSLKSAPSGNDHTRSHNTKKSSSKKKKSTAHHSPACHSRGRASSIGSANSASDIGSVASRSSSISAASRSSSVSGPKSVSQSFHKNHSGEQPVLKGRSDVGIAMRPSKIKSSDTPSPSSKPKKAAIIGSASSFWDDYDVLGRSSSTNAAAPLAAARPATHGANSTHTSLSQSTRVRHATPTRLVRADHPVIGSPESFARSRDSDLQTVIQSLEEEFTSLNSQYRSLLKTVSSPHPNATRPGASTEDILEASFEADEKEGLLVDVIQKMHRKSEMLRKLKSPSHDSRK